MVRIASRARAVRPAWSISRFTMVGAANMVTSRVRAASAKTSAGSKAARLRDHVARASTPARVVEPGAVRHRRGIDERIAAVHRVDVGEIAEGHGEQVALRDHHALRLAGRARGIEQPGEIVGRRRRGHRLRPCVVVVAAFQRDRRLHASLDPGCSAARGIVGDERRARAGVLDDEGGLLRMQLAVDRTTVSPAIQAPYTTSRYARC